MGKYTDWAIKKAARTNRVYAEAIAAAEATDTTPRPTVGILADGLPTWEPNKAYPKNTLFVYDGIVGFTRQDLTTSEIYPPFSPGTEALYGVRPIPGDAGIYPYVYNMAAAVDMLIKDDGITYRCIQDIDPMLYPPASIPAHFVVAE